MSALDDAVKNLTVALKKHKLWDNNVFVLQGDKLPQGLMPQPQYPHVNCLVYACADVVDRLSRCWPKIVLIRYNF